jgi:phage protein D
MEEKQFCIKPTFQLTIDGKNVTEDVTRFLSSVDFSERLEAESDSVSLVLDDISRLWQADWYPQQGDALTLKIGYEGNMLDCGAFEIDEIELSLPPDTLTIKAIATAINKDLRTKKSVRYENQPLRKIAQAIADRQGLKLNGDTSRLSQIEIGSKMQNNESDISFLAKLCKEYGIIFSVKGDDLIFYNAEDLEKEDAILTITRGMVSKASFRDKTSETFESATVSKRDVRKNSVVGWRQKKDGDPTKKDDLIVPGRVENDSQAKAKAEGSLREKNKDKLTASFSIDGNPKLRSGFNVEMENFGAFSGKWTIKESRHSISVDSGYITDVSLVKGIRPRTIQNPSKTGGVQQDWAKTIGIK